MICPSDLYNQIMDATGGDPGIRDMRALESAIASPWQAFGGPLRQVVESIKIKRTGAHR